MTNSTAHSSSALLYRGIHVSEQVLQLRRHGCTPEAIRYCGAGAAAADPDVEWSHTGSGRHSQIKNN